MVQARAAAHDLDAGLGERAQVVERRGACAGELHAAVVHEHRLRQLVELRQGEHEALHQHGSQLVVPRAHELGRDHRHPAARRGRIDRRAARGASRLTVRRRRALREGHRERIFAALLADGFHLERLRQRLQIVHRCLVVNEHFEHALPHGRERLLGAHHGKRARLTPCVDLLHRLPSFSSLSPVVPNAAPRSSSRASGAGSLDHVRR